MYTSFQHIIMGALRFVLCGPNSKHRHPNSPFLSRAGLAGPNAGYQTRRMFLCANLGCSKVEMESDCSFRVDSIKLMDEYMGPDVMVVMECKEMALDLAGITFKHIR